MEKHVPRNEKISRSTDLHIFGDLLQRNTSLNVNCGDEMYVTGESVIVIDLDLDF